MYILIVIFKIMIKQLVMYYVVDYIMIIEYNYYIKLLIINNNII